MGEGENRWKWAAWVRGVGEGYVYTMARSLDVMAAMWVTGVGGGERWVKVRVG